MGSIQETECEDHEDRIFLVAGHFEATDYCDWDCCCHEICHDANGCDARVRDSSMELIRGRLTRSGLK